MKILFTMLMLCLTALPAFAFTPDGEELAATLHKNYGPMTSWEAKMTFPSYPGVSVRLWSAGGRWRQEWQGAGDAAVAIGSGGNTVAACSAGGFALNPLFVWMPPKPLDAWKRWGVDTAVGNYGFCGELPCLMLGAEPGDETKPAVRLNNETGAPLLVRYASANGMVSVGFSRYETFAGYSVPKRVAVRAGGETLEAVVEWTRLNDADKPELYERDLSDVAPCAEPPMPFPFLRDTFRFPQAK